MAAVSATPTFFSSAIELVIDEDMHVLEQLFFRTLEEESPLSLSLFIEERCPYSSSENIKVLKFFDIALLFCAETGAWKTALKIACLLQSKAFTTGNFLRVFTLAIDSDQQKFLRVVRFFHPKLLNKDQKKLLERLLKDPLLPDFLIDV